MGGGWWLVIAAMGAAALAGMLVRICVGDIWDAIAAVATFFALFATGGSWLGQMAESWLRGWNLLAYDTPRALIVASVGLVTASLAAAAASTAICCLRRVAARVRHRSR